MRDRCWADVLRSCSAMGKSRSAAVVCAYLIHRYGVTVDEALAQVRQGRAFCEPNDGFMKQLQIFYENRDVQDVRESAAYQRWLYAREVELSTVSLSALVSNMLRS